MSNDDALSNFIESDGKEIYTLKLFITGASPVSIRAINNLKSVLDQHLKDNYDLEVIDVHQQPSMVRNEDVTAIPMLIKKAPLPVRRLVGDMSETEKVLKGLGLI